MKPPAHMKQLDRQLKSLLDSPRYRYGERRLMLSDGPGVYVFTTQDGRCAYVGDTRKDRTWAQRAYFHFEGKHSNFLSSVQLISHPDLHEAQAFIRTMSIQGIAIPDLHERHALERHAKTYLQPIYCRD